MMKTPVLALALTVTAALFAGAWWHYGRPVHGRVTAPAAVALPPAPVGNVLYPPSPCGLLPPQMRCDVASLTLVPAPAGAPPPVPVALPLVFAPLPGDEPVLVQNCAKTFLGQPTQIAECRASERQRLQAACDAAKGPPKRIQSFCHAAAQLKP